MLDTESAKEQAEAKTRIHRLVQTDRLRQLREGAGLTQGDVARALGVAPSSVSRWESDQLHPRGPRALALLQLLEDLS